MQDCSAFLYHKYLFEQLVGNLFDFESYNALSDGLDCLPNSNSTWPILSVSSTKAPPFRFQIPDIPVCD